MLKKIYFISFIFSFSVALTTFVNSSLLEKSFSESKLSLVYVMASSLALVLLFLMPKIIKFIGVYRFGLIAMTINILASLKMTVANNSQMVGLYFLGFFATISLTYMCFDLLVEHFSSQNQTGHNRGAYLLAINLGWLFAPLLTSLLIKNNEFKPVYYLAQTVTLIATILFLIFVRKFHDVKYNRPKPIETLVGLKKYPQIKNAIWLNFVLQTFFAFMVIYSPIYLMEFFGLKWSQIGVLFSIMLSAFVLFEYPVGILTDKGKIKNVHTIYLGLLIMVFALIAFFNMPQDSNIVLIGLTLFVSRVGAAIYESGTEYFFFKRSSDSDSGFISIFRDMAPLAYIIAPLAGILILKFTQIQTIFIALAIWMLVIGSSVIYKIKQYENEKNKKQTGPRCAYK